MPGVTNEKQIANCLIVKSVDENTYINSGLSTDLMCVNEARLTSSRSTDSAKTGGDEVVESSLVEVAVTGVED